MKYYNSKSRRLHEFLCFRDRDLMIPEKFTQKLIKHVKIVINLFIPKKKKFYSQINIEL